MCYSSNLIIARVYILLILRRYIIFLLQIIVPHGEPVTVDTFLAWRERFEAELALERAK